MRVQFPSVTKKRSELINYFISKHRLTSNERREFKTRSLGTRHNGLSVYDLSDRILSGFHITIFKNFNLILKKLIWEQNYFRYLCSRARKDMKITQQTIYHCYSSLLVKCLSSLRFKFLRYLPFTPHRHHHHQPPSPLPTPSPHHHHHLPPPHPLPQQAEPLLRTKSESQKTSQRGNIYFLRVPFWPVLCCFTTKAEKKIVAYQTMETGSSDKSSTILTITYISKN